MKLAVQERNIMVQGANLEQRTASIELNPIIFQILSGKIYSNKILAVIRELSCNAADSHKQAGHTKPFDVQLPTQLEPVFRIRDYGVGLSHEDVFNLYMTFGASSKRNSDDLIGGLGIGSKAPLAYTSGFTVVSFFNGEQRSYRVFIAEDGKPATMHLHTAPTTEANGLEITVPVKVTDVRPFEVEASSFYKYFKSIPPHFVGKSVDVEKVEYNYKDTAMGWGWRKKYNYTMNAVMGDVAYPFEYRDLSSHKDYNSVLTEMINSPLDIFFNIGELDVAASREGLSFTPQTQARIITRLLKIRETEIARVTKLLQEAPTLWDAHVVYANDAGALRNWTKNTDVLYKGRSVHSKINIQPAKDYEHVYGVTLDRDDFRKTTLYKRTYQVTQVCPADVKMIVLVDTVNRKDARLRTLWDTLGGILDKEQSTMIVLDVANKEHILKNFFSQIEGHPKLVLLSTVTPDSRYIKQSTPAERIAVRVCNMTTRNTVDLTSYDLSSVVSDVVYITTENASCTIKGCKTELSSLIHILRKSGYQAGSVLLLPKSRVSKKVKEHKHLISLEDWLVRPAVVKALRSEASWVMRKEQVKKISYDYFSENVATELGVLYPSTLLFRNYREAVRKARYMITNEDEVVCNLVTNLGNTFPEYKNINILPEHTKEMFGLNFEEGDAFFKKYPLLKHLKVFNKEEIEGYMNLVDNAIKTC